MNNRRPLNNPKTILFFFCLFQRSDLFVYKKIYLYTQTKIIHSLYGPRKYLSCRHRRKSASQKPDHQFLRQYRHQSPFILRPFKPFRINFPEICFYKLAKTLSLGRGYYFDHRWIQVPQKINGDSQHFSTTQNQSGQIIGETF